jgi:hypothetical protein
VNLFTISVPGFLTFVCYLIIAEYLLRMAAQKLAGRSIGQGLGALIH